MAAAEHKRYRRLFHAGYQLGNGKTGLHIAADRIDEHQKAVNIRAFLHTDKLRNHMLVFGGFGLSRKQIMPFDLPGDHQGMNGDIVFFGGNAAAVGNVAELQLLLFGLADFFVFGFRLVFLFTAAVVRLFGVGIVCVGIFG